MSSAHLIKFNSVKPADIEWREGLPFSKEFNDVYFSEYGAVEESSHVFISGNQLLEDWSSNQQSTFTVAELGFGSGLNFLNTAKHWQQHKLTHNTDSTLHYLSIEKRPFSLDDLKRTLALWPEFSEISSKLILNYPSTTYGRHQIEISSEKLTLTLLFMPVEDALDDLIAESNSRLPSLQIDHWFLDGFAPSKNEAMWATSVTRKIAALSKPKTRLATYSVAGIVKKPIKDAGFKITKQKGFAKKREMLTAVYDPEISPVESPRFINFKYDKPWFNLDNQIAKLSSKRSSVAIIGGGIAGCSLAYALSKRNVMCDLYEKEEVLANAASGAAAGIFHPQLTSDLNLSSQFNWQAYLTLIRFLAELSHQQLERIFIQRGLDRFLKDNRTTNELIELSNKFHLQRWINKSEQFPKSQRCIQYLDAGAINIAELCNLYISLIPTDLVSIFKNESVRKLKRTADGWNLESNNREKNYQHVVYCGGAQNGTFKLFNNIETNTTRGQTCFLNKPELSRHVKRAICEQVYLVAKDSECLHIGTTFDKFQDDNLNEQSQKEILDRTTAFLKEVKLAEINTPDIEQSPLIGTVGYRLHSMDRLPLVGPAFDDKKLSLEFENFGQKKIARNSVSHYNKKGLWLNTAYGSHGLLYSLLASKHLASLINNEFSPLQKTLADAINPTRFLVKDLK